MARSRHDPERDSAEPMRWLSLMHDVTTAIDMAPTWESALHQALGLFCEAERWQIGYVYLPDPDRPDIVAPAISCVGDERLRTFHIASARQRYVRGQDLPGRVYAANAAFWADDVESLLAAIPKRASAARRAGLKTGAALPIAAQSEVIAVVELFSDLPHPGSRQLADFMHDVAGQFGRVIERERAAARLADLVWRGQQDLLHTLHDSLGQTLTGLGMLSAGLRHRLSGSDPASADTAAEVARQAQHALDQVRLLARSRFPGEVAADCLMTALRDLAAATASLHTMGVRVEGEGSGALKDGKVATHLYRIAQEAVTNSVKHSRAEHVTIRLESRSGLMRLQIADDGSGIPHAARGNGAGLRIMRHRAASIGASLAIERGAAGGTVVTCTLREPAASPRREA